MPRASGRLAEEGRVIPERKGTIKPSPPYTRLAELYDRHWTGDFAREVFERVSTLLKGEGVKPGAMIDLACGTGRLAMLFAAKGWTVTGVDISKDMLAVAERNARKAKGGRKITFVRGDMRKWSKAKAAELVTCVYDSLNHLPSKSDLQKVFRNVYKTLKPGGIFLFDLNDQAFYETYWNGRVDFAEGNDHSLVVRLTYSAKQSTGRVESTAFFRKGKVYERVQEVVMQRMFTSSNVARMLGTAGFVDINARRFNPIPLPHQGTIKTFWSAKKDPA